MGDFIRFILTAPHDLTLEKLREAFHALDPDFTIMIDAADPESGDLMHGAEFFGEIALGVAGDTVIDEDLVELRDLLTEGEPEADALRARLDQAHGIIALGLSEAGHENYDRIDPFWDWLFTHYDGLLQIDDEGFYDQAGLIA